MKYIYYILGIMAILTIGIAIRFSGLKVEISEPAIVINDRIISKQELDERRKFGSYHSQGKGFLDSVVTREILIQEAVKQGINQEEAFRKSVENFYEQSLIKILIDRKFQSINPTATNDMVNKYTQLSGKTIRLTKFVYRSKEDIQRGSAESTSEVKKDFENLSDSLKYALLFLKPGELSTPEQTETGYVVYRLDSVSAETESEQISNSAQINEFLVHESKRVQFEEWLNQLKTNANVRILATDIPK